MRRSPVLILGGVLVAGLLGGGLTGCSNAKKTLGLERRPPDEFAVVARAPLAVPPEYDLRPPEPGAPRPQEGTTRDQARNTVLGAGGAGYSRNDFSRGEQALLKLAGTDRNVDNIRQVVDRETSALAAESEEFTDRLMFWDDQIPFGAVVDADKESQRIRENQALGRAITTGETPTIERRKKALLEGIF
ncbi:DUF3035 domain-containing protein [Roseospirillum parvum]|uniref:Beta-barrel assembly machine subunit BamF n=1 Tax=Roseospirillum parvum TaxID=83401 RepID=A0A1G7WXU6_9PROT|nr:DUF3035 domain-containing protein [Roseospirillum parvum]SDG76743.1 Protein of unknown function [Roseospirillum parvum]